MNQVRIMLRQPLLAIMLLSLSFLITACSDSPSDNPPSTSNTIIYEGARLIIGNGELIENASFSVENGLFVDVGTAANVSVPEGATRVDLNGLTVMPAIIDAHVHLSTTRDALIEDLERRASQGITAALSLGSDGIDTPLELRDEIIPGAARYLSAGRGITAPEPGRSTTPHWITNESEARQAVRDEVARKVNFIKIWVDDRNGQFEKLNPELYSAVIDEAHQHGLLVTAHIFTLEDAGDMPEATISSISTCGAQNVLPSVPIAIVTPAALSRARFRA